jgi:K+-transporting ATPase ATPase C chain
MVYPLMILGIGQVLFHDQANGSLIKNDQGEVIGSALIGQPFSSERYFNSRPSTVNYSSTNPQNDPQSILKTGLSGASNLSPGHPDLRARIAGNGAEEGMISQLKRAGIAPTADLIYSSGSGLDPHITPLAAILQIPRIAQQRHLDPDSLKDLVKQYTERRFLRIFGEPGVNVFKLNLALDRQSF